MPVDPSIPLGVVGGNKGMMSGDYNGSAAGFNSLATVNAVAEAQNKLNQNKMFQLQLAARQKLGKIVASAPNLDAAIQAAAADPDVAGMVPDLVNTLAATTDTLQKYRGQVYTQTRDALTSATEALGGFLVAGGEKGAKAALRAKINSIADQNIKSNVDSNMTHILDALDGLTPEQKMQAITGAATAAGSFDLMGKIWAQPGIVDKGDVKQPVTVAGAVPTISGRVPGSIQNSDNPLQLGLPPGTYNPESMIAGGKYGAGGGGAKSAPSDAELSQAETKIGADGKPLVTPGLSMDSPPVDRSSFGVPVGSQAASIAEMNKKWSGPETEAYQNSGILLGQLAEMKHNLGELEAGKGFMSPGSGAEFRLGVAKLGKLVEDLTGADIGVDKAKIANAEDAMKLTQRLGISYLTSALGSQREAAETIRNITEKGIPGIQNTYLGSALMIDMIEAVAKRSMEEHEFRTIWQARPKNRGNLTGADIAFNKSHPASDYIKLALEKNGLNREGTAFASRAAMDDALARGLITPAQAEIIRQNKGKIPADLPKSEPQETKE